MFNPGRNDEMNRIQNLAGELSSTLPHTAIGLELESAEPLAEQSHCVFTPLHYERNYAYPLVVWLHGPDDDERQVTRIMPLVSLRNYVAVGARGTIAGEVKGSYAWSQSPSRIALAHERVNAAIAAARRWLNVAGDRVYLAGYGCGGTTAIRIALARPDEFAGVMSIGGGFPTGNRPLARLHAVRSLRILLSTARDSQSYPPAQVCQHLRLFHAAGMSVDLRQYPCGDELMTNMLSDMDRWIMNQLNATIPAESERPSPRSSGR